MTIAVRSIVAVVLVSSALYGLFADTFRHYRPASRPAGELRFSYWGGYTDHQMWGEIAAAFESQEPGLHIHREWLPLSGYSAKLDQQFIAGDAPDIILFQDEPFQRYANEQFAALEEYLTRDSKARAMMADCWPTAMSSFECQGRLRGVPASGGNVLVFCNLDAFQRASVFRNELITPPTSDWTLEQFVDLCRKLTFDEDGDGRTDQFGFLQPHWVYYLPFIWSHGATLMDGSRMHWTLQGPQAVSAFRFYADLRWRWGVTPTPMEYAGQNSDTAFLTGRVAMCVNGPWFIAFLKETALRDRFCVAPIPSGPGGSQTRVTWDGLCIYSRIPRQRKESAWRFLRFVLSAQAQRIFARYQRAIPARESCAADYVSLGGGPGSAADAFIRALSRSRMQPITRGWMLINRAMTGHLTSVLLDGAARKSPEEAVAELARDPAIQEALACVEQ